MYLASPLNLLGGVADYEQSVLQCMAGIWRFFCFYYGFVVPACIALSGSIGQYKSLHMFGHSIYNRSVIENSFCFSYFLMLSYISSGMDS